MGNEQFFYEKDLSGCLVKDFGTVNTVIEQMGAPFRFGPAHGDLGIPHPDGVLPQGNRCAVYTAKLSSPGEYDRLDKALEMHREQRAVLEGEPADEISKLPSVIVLEAILGARLSEDVRKLYESIAHR